MTMPVCKSVAHVELERTSPTFAGHVFFRSADRHRLAGVFAESGVISVTYTYTEFLVVLAGEAIVRTEEGHQFILRAGDAAVFEPGQTVQFDLSEDFRDVVYLTGEQPLPY